MLFVALIISCASANAKQYSLAAAIETAQTQDPWLAGSRFRQENLKSLSVSAGALPDPTVSLGLANLPIDTLDFDQEGMTQFKVGVSQRFPRGQSLSLRQERLARLSGVQPFAREDRKAKVAVTVAHLWLEAYRSQKTIYLIEKDRSLFEHLVDVAQSSYTTAFGRTRQQDLVRAQLELTQLEDRLTQLHQRRETQLARMGQWLGDRSGELSIDMPDAVNINIPTLVNIDQLSVGQLTQALTQHPLVKSIEQKLSAGQTAVKLARQSYKPQWGVNVSYGYREADALGNDRSDFFSVGVSFDMPLFTAKRQDRQVQAASAEYESIKTEQALTLRELRAGFATANAGYLRLLERKQLFDTRLLKEISQQAEASLKAYTNDDGDFAEVVRARIAELNARIDALNVEIDIQKTIAQLNYFLIAYSETGRTDSTAFSDTSKDAAGDIYE